MGLLDRVRRAIDKATSSTEVVRDDGFSPLTIGFSVAFGPGGPAEPLSGTNTVCKGAISRLVTRRRVALPAMLILDAVAQREPSNAADPNAIAVVADGERIGYLPGGTFARDFDLPIGTDQPVSVQLFVAERDGKQRATGWAWLGSDAPEWKYGPDRWPPMTARESESARHEETRARLAADLEEGGRRAAEVEAGMMKGVHYLELVEPIKELKRAGRLEDALSLCYAAIVGAEGGRLGREPAPWYTEQAAIVLRKLGRRDDEIAVLRRYLVFIPADQRTTHPFGVRLAKLGVVTSAIASPSRAIEPARGGTTQSRG